MNTSAWELSVQRAPGWEEREKSKRRANKVKGPCRRERGTVIMGWGQFFPERGLGTESEHPPGS